MALINTTHIYAPWNNTCRVSEVSSTDLARTEWNGVDIQNPWKKFTEDEWYTKLGDQGQEILMAKRRSCNGRNHAGYGYGGHGRGGHWGRGGCSGRGGCEGPGGRGNNDNQSNNDNNNNNMRKTASGDRTVAPMPVIGGNP